MGVSKHSLTWLMQMARLAKTVQNVLQGKNFHMCGTSIPPNAILICVRSKPGVSFSSSCDTSTCTPCSPSCLEDQVVLECCAPTGNIRWSSVTVNASIFPLFLAMPSLFCFFEVLMCLIVIFSSALIMLYSNLHSLDHPYCNDHFRFMSISGHVTCRALL